MAVPANTDLLPEHRPYVIRLCGMLLHDPNESEDAAQEVFLHAYRALDAGVRPFNVRAWLAEIARNECRSRARSAAAHPEAPLPEGLLDEGVDPSDLAAQHALVARVQQELADLPDRQREAVLLREFRGLSYNELAVEMHATESAVESLLQRARRRLTERLEGARRPLVGLALAMDSVRNAFARLLPGPGAAEAGTAVGATAVVAKLTAVGAVAVTVGVSTGDVRRVSPAPSAPALGKRIASPSSESLSSEPTSRLSFRPSSSESERRGPSQNSSHGPRGDNRPYLDAVRISSGPDGESSGGSGDDSWTGGSGSSGPGSGVTESGSVEEPSTSGHSGSDSSSSGPGSGLESSSSSGSSDHSDSDGSGSSGPGSDGLPDLSHSGSSGSGG